MYPTCYGVRLFRPQAFWAMPCDPGGIRNIFISRAIYEFPEGLTLRFLAWKWNLRFFFWPRRAERVPGIRRAGPGAGVEVAVKGARVTPTAFRTQGSVAHPSISFPTPPLPHQYEFIAEILIKSPFYGSVCWFVFLMGLSYFERPVFSPVQVKYFNCFYSHQSKCIIENIIALMVLILCAWG